MSKIKTSVNNFEHSDNIIKSMYEKAFNEKADYIKISKLSGGLKNAVYLIANGSKEVVLKIATNDESKMITADKSTFWWEAKMLEFFKNVDIPTPKLLFYDDSESLISSSYIFMSYINGKTLLETKELLSELELSKINYQIGEICSVICKNKSQNFFLPHDPKKYFDNNYEFIYYLYSILIEDAKKMNVKFTKLSFADILNELQNKKESLKNITNLCLNHADIWDGNILVNNGNVVGIVDFSDIYYCDELFTFYFHTIEGILNQDFLKGFCKKSFSEDEMIRMEFYRAYVLLKMIVDCELKSYGKHEWIYEKFENSIQRVKKY